MKMTSKTLISAQLALGLLLAPAIALADNNTIQLKPMQPENNVYSNTSKQKPGTLNSFPASSDLDNGYGLPSYGNTYYAPANNASMNANNTLSNSTGNGANTLNGHITAIPKGTLLSIQTDQAISSYAAHIGDPINATLENDLYINDSLAVPAGSQIQGQVVTVSNASMMGKHGEIDVRFDDVKLQDGRVIPINAHIVTHDKSGILRGDTYMVDVAKGVGIAAGATGAGALVGTAAGSLLGSVGTGAVFGLGVGALGGMGYAMARKGKDVIVPAGSRMSLVIDTPVTVNN